MAGFGRRKQLRCPYCGSLEHKVTESNVRTKNMDEMKRYRQCSDCHCKFSTLEVNEEKYRKLEENSNKFKAIQDACKNMKFEEALTVATKFRVLVESLKGDLK